MAIAKTAHHVLKLQRCLPHWEIPSLPPNKQQEEITNMARWTIDHLLFAVNMPTIYATPHHESMTFRMLPYLTTTEEIMKEYHWQNSTAEPENQLNSLKEGTWTNTEEREKENSDNN